MIDKSATIGTESHTLRPGGPPLVPTPRRHALWGRIFRNRPATIGGAIVLAIALLALFAPLIAPFDPDQIGAGRRLLPPDTEHLLGTDEFGRDLLSRLLFGARQTLYIGIGATGIGMSFGLLIGAIAAYTGGWAGALLMRAIDLLYTFPDVLIAFGLVALLGPDLTNSLIAVGISAIPYYGRVTYGVVLAERQKSYVSATQAIGASHARVILRHLVPNILPSVVVVASLGLSAAIQSAAALSFLGLGAQPPSPEWGLMLSIGRNYIIRAPWLVVDPGVAIFLTVMAFNLLGDGFRDLLSPRRRQSKL